MKWKSTSAPVVVHDKRTGKWRLNLRYTPTKKKTRRVQSRWYDTEDEAKATADWWRLSWEQGNQGERVDPPEGPDEVSTAEPLPQGKSIVISCCVCMTNLGDDFTVCSDC